MSDDEKPTILGSALAQVNRVLAEVPGDKRSVWVTTVDKRGNIRSGAAIRVGEHWTFGAEAQWTRETRDLDGFAFIKAEWD